ncbi:MAG: phosphoribosylanthranilate isomerase [Anaerolineaceae bacterium]|nr:phosphoribosylanthranilate isomerase [Anaerolineaceae bacterium]
MIVKICGITTLEDALACIEAGADWLGFNFYPPSPRYLTPTACVEIAAVLRRSHPGVKLVGVFVNAPIQEVTAILDGCRLHLAQLCGHEPPEHLAMLGEQAFKALRPANATALEAELAAYRARIEAPAWLIDAYRPGQFGGTGHTADWSLAAGLAQRAPILLAGGLKPGNVAAAVAQVRPWGVDVASGVESAPGRKDVALVRAFVQAASSPLPKRERVG